MNSFSLLCCMCHLCVHGLAWPLLSPLACLLRITHLPNRENCMLLRKLTVQLPHYFGYLKASNHRP